MKTIFYFLVILLISSCNSSFKSNEIYLLEHQNDSLKREIDRLSQLNSTYLFRPIVVPKSRTISLGEEYVADVVLSAVDSLFPPITILCYEDTINHELVSLSDTLPYSSKFQASIYRFKPTSKGKKKWSGKIIQHMHGVKNEFGFSVEYYVK
jgi:hypothetical protein